MIKNTPPQLTKVSSGVTGLDEITNGGLPAGRPTLLCGNAGCGKTLLAMQFLINGIVEHNEPGVFISFEENRDDLALNVSSIGYDLPALVTNNQLYIDHIDLNNISMEQSGDFDLEGLFIRLDTAINRVGAQRVVIDTIEVLFAQLPDQNKLRQELHRLFIWLKQQGMTAIITAEAGEHSLTRHGIEEYVSDCVIMLDNRVNEQISSRRLRVVKYRGSTHGSNEYPFLISEEGISILPITSLTLQHTASNERIATGIKGLDDMLGGAGYYRGSSILVTGTAGTGKSSFAAHLTDASVRRNEKVLYFSYEESTGQIVRNMASIGMDLEQWIDNGLLEISSMRPTAIGLESHLIGMLQKIDKFQPSLVIIDPLNSFISEGSGSTVKIMTSRLLDYLKTKNITALSNSLTSGDDNPETTEVDISSLMDTWLLLRNSEIDDVRSHTVTIIKSRGMPHSTHVHYYRITDQGIVIEPAAAANAQSGPEKRQGDSK